MNHCMIRCRTPGCSFHYRPHRIGPEDLERKCPSCRRPLWHRLSDEQYLRDCKNSGGHPKPKAPLFVEQNLAAV